MIEKNLPPDSRLTAAGLEKFAHRPPEITILSDHAASGSLNLSDSPDQIELRSRLAATSQPRDSFDPTLPIRDNRLDLRRSGLADAHMRILETMTAFRQLRLLSLAECPGITSAETLPPSLVELWLEGCQNLKAVDHLPPSLTMLKLNGCTGLSAVAVQKLKASRKWEYFAGTEGNR